MRCFPTRAKLAIAARAGFEPAVGELTAFNVQVPITLKPVKDVKPDEWTAPVPAAHPALKPVTLPDYDSLGKKDEKK